MIKQKIHNLINSILQTPFSTQNIVLTVISIILVRLGIENWLSIFSFSDPLFYFYEFIHTTTFFSIFFVICVFLLIKIATLKKQTALIVFLFAFIMIIFPPIFDKIIATIYFNNASFMSYYLFDSISGLGKSFITFFGDRPTDGITYGTRIMAALAITFFALITWIKTKSFLRTVLMITVTYFVFFFMSSLPSVIAFAILPQHLDTTRVDIASLIASPNTILGNSITNPIIAINVKMSLVYLLTIIGLILLLTYKANKKLFISLAKNIRPIQTVYHIGLLCVGIAIALAFGEVVLLYSFFTFLAFLLLCIAVIFAWYSTVIFNDCIDQKIDAISNPKRPLIIGVIDVKTYKKIGLLFALSSIIITTAISPKATLALIMYHALSFLYNTPPLRLKKFPVIATFIAALASFFIVAIGFITVTPNHSLTNFPTDIIVLLLVSYTISLPIKDLKDIAGDKANDIYTIPVLFGEKIGRMVIAIGIFVSLMLSVFILGVKFLLFPALLSGILVFWTLVGHKKDKFIFSAQTTILITFIIIAIYATILTLSFFL